MAGSGFEELVSEIGGLAGLRVIGRVAAIGTSGIRVIGLERQAALGDLVRLTRRSGETIGGEIIALEPAHALLLPDGPVEGVQIGDAAELDGPAVIAPHAGWIGRVVDSLGRPLDGRPLLRGRPRPLRAAPPPPSVRRPLGARLATGLAVFDTLLPIVGGQRIGLFAGSGVGKSTLIGALTREIEADVAVVALVGERGREVREFVERVLGPEGMARSVVVAATSDRSPLERRRAALAAMTVAEHFRDGGASVLFVMDSVTRFAEAHREIALAAGEGAALGGYPPSLAPQIMALAERAGTGSGDAGDITALFSVLVAGSDMEEPVADILRGVLDGHVVLDRAIAERGRFPAVDVLRSVSRSLPDAASAEENGLITAARRVLATYDRSATMIQAGLYAAGSDPAIDEAIRLWPALDSFVAEPSADIAASFTALAGCLSRRPPARGPGSASAMPDAAAPGAPQEFTLDQG